MILIERIEGAALPAFDYSTLTPAVGEQAEG